MIASLPMYDRPETAGAHDRLWQGVRKQLGHGPPRLTRSPDLWEQWQSPDLLLSQTCGYPYRARLHDKVGLVGTPVYDIEAPPGYYYSVFVARKSDQRELAGFRDAKFAYNEALSQSGWAAPQNHAAALGFAFSCAQRSGGHLQSARLVAEEHADIAAIDALTWKLICRYEPFATRLRVLERTAPTPALPYITAKTRKAPPLYTALRAAIAKLAPEDRETLGLKSVTRIEPAAYLEVPNPPPPKS